MKDDEIKKLINDAFRAPEPERKQEFIKKLRSSEISTFRMVLGQIPYIRPYAWILSAVIVAIAVFGSVSGREETEMIVSLIMPFCAAVVILENERSKKHNMWELEMATRFSLRSVFFARMTILGLLSVIVAALISPLIAHSFGFDAVVTAEFILIPYLVTMIVSLHIERSRSGRDNGFLSIAVAGVVSFVLFFIRQTDKAMDIYLSIVYGSMGIVLFAVLFALTLTELWMTVRNVEVFA